jgi:hypothetical protein
MKSSRPWLFACGGILACGLLAFLVFVIGYASSGSAPTRPLVRVTGTNPEGPAVANQAVVIFAEASDPDGIASVELWINGSKTTAQDNPDASSRLPFETSQAWIPNGPGNYLAVLKATDLKGVVGESDPLPIVVGERSFEPDPTLVGEYLVREGDTWELIAAGLGTTPDELRSLNPGLGELTPGTSLRIPPRPEGDDGGDAAPPSAPEDIADMPHVDPPGLPPDTAPGGEGGAEPAPGPWWGPLPLPDGFICILNPSLCGHPTDVLPPPAPSGVEVRAGSGCDVEVSWIDESADEVGFRLYRITSRPRFRFDLVETFVASPGTGRGLSYVDTHPPRGTFSYTVVSYNSGGNTWSPPSADYTSAGCPADDNALALVVEGLSIETAGGFDRLYCYASLGDSPFERVPHSAGSFMTLEAGAWNIAEHFSGSNKRSVVVHGDGPLNIVVECLGWQGAELINLGRFTRAHPPPDWDGRTLSATSESGGFTVTYRINYGYETIDEGTGRTAWPLVDGSLPVPYNLRPAAQWLDCRRMADGIIPCGLTVAPSLTWDYTVSAAAPRPAIAYNVYRRLDGEEVPTLYHTAISPSRSAPLAAIDCALTAYYSVGAVVGNDPLTGEEIQSPPSSELEVPPSCASLEITLTELYVYGAYDPDHDYEAYGTLWFNGTPVIWNAHCDGGGCLTSGPSYTSVHEATVYSWADMFLSIGHGRYARSNNVLRVPIHDGETLRWSLVLWDHNELTDDYTWCGGRRVHTVAARSIAEWLSFDQDVTWNDPYAEPGACALYFHVRGLPAGAP